MVRRLNQQGWSEPQSTEGFWPRTPVLEYIQGASGHFPKISWQRGEITGEGKRAAGVPVGCSQAGFGAETVPNPWRYYFFAPCLHKTRDLVGISYRFWKAVLNCMWSHYFEMKTFRIVKVIQTSQTLYDQRELYCIGLHSGQKLMCIFYVLHLCILLCVELSNMPKSFLWTFPKSLSLKTSKF